MIIVSGFPRSGTSMMMRILEKGGLKIIDDGFGKNEANPNGFYEVFNQKTAPQWRLNPADGDAVKIPAPWILKTCGNDHTVIFMEREPSEIIASMRKLFDPTLWFLTNLLSVMRLWLMNRHHVVINYNKVLEDPRKELSKIKGMLPDFEEAIKVVDQKLYRNRKKEEICH